MKRYLALLPIVLLAAGATGLARPIDYGNLLPDSIRSCEDPYHRGQRATAAACYAAVLSAPGSTNLAKAEAAWGLNQIKQANRYFRSAAKNNPDDATIRVRWGLLFSQTHQDADAQRLFEEVLAKAPENNDARLGLAALMARQFENPARDLVTSVIQSDHRRVDAYLLDARINLEIGNLKAVESGLELALKLVQDQSHPPLDTYALAASLDLMRGETDSPWTQKALDYHPRFGDIFAVPAYFLVINRYYRQAVEILRQAVEVQPDHFEAHAELGVNLLRINEFEAAGEHLRRAYQGDPYDPRTVNTLRLLDSLDDFVVLDQGPEDGSPGISMRLHADEAEVLRPYVKQLADRSIRQFSERYQFNLAEPVAIEMYPNHEDFAVRTLGMPGVGILGVTFGYLLAMDSPSGRPEGEFHWGSTLWHEMAHVFTLEATGHKVPRWFSEGISVYEEWRSGPAAVKTQAPSLPQEIIAAFADNKLLPIAALDQGFIRPSYPGQVMVSYMQAGLICRFIEQKWGFGALVSVLTRFAEGLDTVTAVETVLDMETDQFDRDFQHFIATAYGAVISDLPAWTNHLAAASRAVDEGRWADAINAADLAIQLFPGYVESGSPHLVLARARESQGQSDLALQALLAYREAGGSQPDALRRLARMLDGAGRRTLAIDVLEAVNFSAPLDDELHGILGNWLFQEGRNLEALREYQVHLALEPHDRADAHYRLAKTFHALNDPKNTRTQLLLALEAAPHYRPAQQLLLKTAQQESP